MQIKRNNYSKINIPCRGCVPSNNEVTPENADTLHRRNTPSNNLAETRFTEPRGPPPPSSKSSSNCSCQNSQEAPRMLPNIRVPYSEMDYPSSQTANNHLRYHSDVYNCVNCARCSGSGSGGERSAAGSGSSNYNSDSRAHSPKPGRFHPQHQPPPPRPQSPVSSCHNCGSCISQQQMSQSQSPSASFTSHHVTQHAENFRPLAPPSHNAPPSHIACMSPDISEQQRGEQGGLYSPISGGAYPIQGGMTDSFSQQGGGACPYSPAYSHISQPGALHGYRMPPIDSSARNSSDVEQLSQGYPLRGGIVQDGGANVDRACQSSLPSLANENSRR